MYPASDNYTAFNYTAFLDHFLEVLESRQLTLWLGEDVAATALPVGHRLLRRIALVTHHALSPYFSSLPEVAEIESALQRVGTQNALSLADRTVGRVEPLALEDPFSERRQRLPEWEAMLASVFRGRPQYSYRAIVALLRSGHIARVVTANADELLEHAASDAGFDLPVVHVLEGELPPEEGQGPFLMKFHGSSRKLEKWPLDFHRLHLDQQGPAMAAFKTMLESFPLLMLGHRSPGSFDLLRLLTHCRLRELLWLDVGNQRVEADFFPKTTAYDNVLFGDLPERLLTVFGGWRGQGAANLLFEDVCTRLGVDISGLEVEEEVTDQKDLTDLVREPLASDKLPPSLQSLGARLRERWVGAFALLTHLDVWSEAALEANITGCVKLEESLKNDLDRGWFRYLLAQSGRHQVEAALARHFRGVAVPPGEPGEMRRLEWAVAAIDWLSQIPEWSPISPEEIAVERSELRFALTGKTVYLPKAAQVIAELASVTHAERWLRLKAAGAVSRGQWSVATQELCRALAFGGHASSPLLTARARVGLASVIFRLLQEDDTAPLIGCLRAIKRREVWLAEFTIGSFNCESLGAELGLRFFDEALEGYLTELEPLQPPLSSVLDEYVRLAERTYRDEATNYLLDRDPDQGRSYAFRARIERGIVERLGEKAEGGHAFAHEIFQDFP